MGRSRLSPLIKPVGNACNCSCIYCFYRNRRPHSSKLMEEKVLDKVIQRLFSWGADQIDITWHGGEPFLAGIPFYQSVIEIQKKYNTSGITVTNSFQTNGTLVSDDWITFCEVNNFDIGLSFDGVPDVHRLQRPLTKPIGKEVDISDTLNLLKKRNLPIHAICVITKNSLNRYKDIINYCVDNSFTGLELAPFLPAPAEEGGGDNSLALSYEDYVDFLCNAFDYWLLCNTPSFRIRIIDSLIAAIFKREPLLCSMQSGTSCGLFITIDNKGDIYLCDNFDYDEENFNLGNIANFKNREDIYRHPKYLSFKDSYSKARDKLGCDNCDIAHACTGGCPRYKHLLNRDKCISINRLINYIESNVNNVIKEAI